MNFGEQIKRLRQVNKITQKEMGEKLRVSRQAISHWENDRNLPDIEMLIIISRTYHISLDDLILGGNEMNNMTEKIIRDGSENRRMSMNLTGIKIGAGLLLLSILSWLVGVLVPVTLENYFGSAASSLLIGGVLVFIIIGMQNTFYLFSHREKEKNSKLFATGGIICILGTILYVSGMFIDSTIALSSYGLLGILLGIIIFGIGFFKNKSEK